MVTEPACEELGYGNSKHTCETLYNCCDCGDRDNGCGCAYCWSCRACSTCFGDDEVQVNLTDPEKSGATEGS